MWSERRLRGDYAGATDDYRVVQDWSGYTAAEHELWRTLFARQHALLPRYAAPEVASGLRLLGSSADAIPRLDVMTMRSLA